MQKTILIIVAVALVGCGTTPEVGGHNSPKGKNPTPSPSLNQDVLIIIPAQPTRSSNPPASQRKPKIPANAFVNSLGMPFVRVLGTEVAFCIWETRVRDYAAYANSNEGVNEYWKFETRDRQPVSGVNWHDAKAFCQWLTKKERAAGKITANQSYRLPSDAEWSVAVGLGRENHYTISDKNYDSSTKGVYPWGKEWPPPKEAGNYGQSLNVDSYGGASPVGSFAPNKFGLYDLGGNVVEWCEDWYDSVRRKSKVIRDASYSHFGADVMRSSARGYDIPTPRRRFVGFRCVLTNGNPLPKENTASPTPPKTKPTVLESAIRKYLNKHTGKITKADLANVRKLSITGKQVTEVPEGIENLKQLTNLGLVFNKLTSVERLRKLTQLRQLRLQSNKLTNVKGLETLINLELLAIGGNQLTDVKGLEKLTKLETLSLDINQLTNVDLEKLTQLKLLNLDQNQLTDVKGLEKLTQLSELRLNSNKLKDVNGLEKLTQLTLLHIGGNQLTELPKGLENLVKLEELNLGGNQLTDIKVLGTLTQLKRLYLFNTQLTGVKGLEKFTQLKKLWLQDNPALTKAQIDNLQKALPKCEIYSNPTK